MSMLARNLYAILFAALFASVFSINGHEVQAQDPPSGTPAQTQDRPSLPFSSSREPEIKP